MYLENRFKLMPLSLRLAAVYGENIININTALCHIIHKYKCNTIQEAGQVFIDLYEKNIKSSK